MVNYYATKKPPNKHPREYAGQIQRLLNNNIKLRGNIAVTGVRHLWELFLIFNF